MIIIHCSMITLIRRGLTCAHYSINGLAHHAPWMQDLSFKGCVLLWDARGACQRLLINKMFASTVRDTVKGTW